MKLSVYSLKRGAGTFTKIIYAYFEENRWKNNKYI